MTDFNSRLRCVALRNKVMSAKDAAELIMPNMTIGTSGFTPAGYPKAVALALAERMKHTPFQINLWTGASVGSELDGALAAVNGICRRMPYQTESTMRKSINSGKVQYNDFHLSQVAGLVRKGFVAKPDIAIIEALAVTEEGNIIPTTSVGNSPVFISEAKHVIIEINTAQPLELEGMHDIYECSGEKAFKPIPLTSVSGRIGTTYIPCRPEKILAVVPCDIPDSTRAFPAVDEVSQQISAHLLDFFRHEVKHGRLPKQLLPMQSGVGSVANASLAGLCAAEWNDLYVYTEVLQDGMLDLFDSGKLKFASTTALTFSPAGNKRFYDNIQSYRDKIILRPQEISNSPDMARQLGVISMNGAIEVDIFGHVNSTHIMGTKMMNGIGGSGDFARAAYLGIFLTPSLAKGGKISSVVPMCSHIDHNEHSTQVFITEQGVADLRGLCPSKRAREIINNCAHPDYRLPLMDYLQRAEKATGHAHTPHILEEALSWHIRFNKTGTMRF